MTRQLNFLERIAYGAVRLGDLDTGTLRRRVRAFARSLAPGTKVLDAGAGLKPYQPFFGHCHYESCDFEECETFWSNIDDGRRDEIGKGHTHICSLEEIPVPDNTYEAVLCTQVLEHVPRPGAVLKELLRVLEPRGTLFVSVPQGYGIHGEPYNYFYFTRFGLELILGDAGFLEPVIEERHGYFFYLYDRLSYAIPRIVIGYSRPWQRLLLMLALLPVHVFLAYILGPLLLCLEPLDREKRFTLGYVARARKPTDPAQPVIATP